MATSLQRNIIQLAHYERECTGLTEFIDVQDTRADRPELYPLIRAADRLIGYLFSYGREFISIGDRYYQPCFEDYPKYVWFNWGGKEAEAFCAGCPMREWDCKACTFSSKCLRFRTAHAVEHVIASTNSLLDEIIDKSRR